MNRNHERKYCQKSIQGHSTVSGLQSLFLHISFFYQNDFELIIKNAKTYNAPETVYYRAAEKLYTFGIKLIEKEAPGIIPDPEFEDFVDDASSFTPILEPRVFSRTRLTSTFRLPKIIMHVKLSLL